jgi:hypothetical protein
MTSKGTRDAAGGWSIRFADQPQVTGDAIETLYGLIEPMDAIEIRMRHGPGTEIPVVMRGFVSSVRRSEAMSGDTPQRMIEVAGQDYGKIWQIIQIYYLPSYVIGEDVISNFKLFERFGVGFDTVLPVQDFVSQVVDRIINPFLANLLPDDTALPKSLQTDISVQHGTTGLSGPQNHEGPLADLLRGFCDVGAWNELYVEDREDGVYVVFRPIPALDLAGDTIQSDAPEPVIVDLPIADVVAMDVARTDANVANFYWVAAPMFDLNSDMTRQLYALASGDRTTVLLDQYANSDGKLYGTRMMQVQTQLGGDAVGSFTTGLDASAAAARDTDVVGWVQDRRTRLVQMNRDNIVFESGSMAIRGREDIRAGSYVLLKRGKVSALYYVVNVSHSFVWPQGFRSTLTVERGTGFAERIKLEGGSSSPWLAEMSEAQDE